jgi:hypothetical protein
MCTYGDKAVVLRTSAEVRVDPQPTWTGGRSSERGRSLAADDPQHWPLGNLLAMAQAGFLSHADTVDSLTLMAKEIMPRLKDYKQPEAAQTAAV